MPKEAGILGQKSPKGSFPLNLMADLSLCPTRSVGGLLVFALPLGAYTKSGHWFVSLKHTR